MASRATAPFLSEAQNSGRTKVAAKPMTKLFSKALMTDNLHPNVLICMAQNNGKYVRRSVVVMTIASQCADPGKPNKQKRFRFLFERDINGSLRMGTAAQRQHFVKNILFISCLSRHHNGSIVQVSRVHMRGVYARVGCACSFALSTVAALPTFPVATSSGGHSF